MQALQYVSQNVDKGYKLLIWLIRLLIMASNPNAADQFKFVYGQVDIVLSSKLLKEKGMGQIGDLQNLAREYTEFCMGGGKYMHGIGHILKLIAACTDGNQLSTFHCQYAKMSLKALAY